MAPESRADKQHLELVTEVRALTIAVGQLHTIFVKRRVLFWCIGVLTALVLIQSGATVYIWYSGNTRTDHLISKLVGGCHSRNKAISGTNRFIRGNVRLQDQSAKITGQLLAQLHIHFTPAEAKRFAKVSGKEKSLLTRWEKTQPGPVPCKLK